MGAQAPTTEYEATPLMLATAGEKLFSRSVTTQRSGSCLAICGVCTYIHTYIHVYHSISTSNAVFMSFYVVCQQRFSYSQVHRYSAKLKLNCITLTISRPKANSTLSPKVDTLDTLLDTLLKDHSKCDLRDIPRQSTMVTTTLRQELHRLPQGLGGRVPYQSETVLDICEML